MISKLPDVKPINQRLDMLQNSQLITMVGSFELDVTTQEFLWTDALFMVFGLPVAQHNKISLSNVMELIDAGDREKVLSHLTTNTATGIHEFDCTITTATGEHKVLHGWCHHAGGEAGIPVKRGSFQDVTRQRKLEDELRAVNQEMNISREISQHLEFVSSTGSYEWNISTGKLKYSDNLYRILGVQPGQQVPSLDFFMQLVHPDDVQKVTRSLNNGMTNGEVHENDYRIIVDGEIRFLETRSRSIVNDRDEIIVAGTVRDKTQEHEIMHKLQQRTLVAELISDNNVDLISAFDNDLKFISWNKKCEEKYKRSKSQVIGKSFNELFQFLAGTEIEAALHKALKGERTYLKESVFADNSGFFDSYVLPLEEGQKIYGALVITHDLTEVKQATEQLRLLNSQLEQKNNELIRSNNELASFSYVASHDLQEPLRKVRTFSERLLEREHENLSDTGKDYLSRMDNASKRMQQLIDDLLAFSRTTTLPKDFKLVDLNDMMLDVKENIKHLVEETNATITSDKLPVANVIAFQFQQLLENLLINSLKYRKEDVAPVIHISYEQAKGSSLPFVPSSLHQVYHKISVTDNGIGFEPEYSEKIFEIFQRLHDKHEYSGTGIGLAIVKKTMENHKGDIIAEGRPGEGATFHIYLPV